jgi:phenylacetate-CoA ligase
MIRDREAETMVRAELEQVQMERLQMTLNRVHRNVAFYKDAFEKAGVDIEKVTSPADLRRLPFTTKDDLRKAYPYDMFAVPLRDIVRLHATSGTTGKPIVTGYTRNDVNVWAGLVARQLSAVGVTEHDVVQVAFNYGLFTGGLGFHYGAERVGASVIPASPAGGHARDQIRIMKDYKATVLTTMPSYALAMASVQGEMDLRAEQLFLRVGIFGAEPWSEAVRAILEEKFHIKAYDTYGVAEVIGPGVAAECGERNGLHINEDHFMVEVIDPATLQPARPGQTGELVFTTLTKEGFPLIRYRTGDLSCILEGTCACGRTLVRMSRVSGRTDDLIFFRGNHLFPSQVQEVLLAAERITPEYQIVLSREDGVDTMEVRVAISEGTHNIDEVGKLVHLQNEIAEQLRRRLRLTAKVSFVEASSLRPAVGRKACRVVDNRDG